VKSALLTLALAVASAHVVCAAVAEADQTSPPRRYHPMEEFSFPLAEAYQASSRHYDQAPPCAALPIMDNYRFCGADPLLDGGENTTAAPGVFSLKATDESPVRLDVNCFATCFDGESQPYVQSYRLVKQVPGSNKCPNTYAPRTFYQFGNGVRTWWPLLYSQPGTRFTLELTVRCMDAQGRPSVHVDVWVWEVVVSFESLQAVIDVLHENPLGTTEVPCVASEDLYRAIKDSLASIRTEIMPPGPRNVQAAQDELFQLEGLILSFTTFTDCFVAENVFSGTFPPSNDIQLGDYGFTGIIDTIENPCACKLLTDLEALSTCYGITSP
jgi:hypothetical protein